MKVRRSKIFQSRKVIALLTVVILLVNSCFSANQKDLANVQSQSTQKKESTKLTGIYLPIKYISNLKKTKSHTRTLDLMGPETSCIILEENSALFISKYHEASESKILSLDNSGIIFQEETYNLKINQNENIVDSGGMEYTKISDDISDYNEAIQRFILNILLSKEKYTSSSRTLINDGGKIEINGKLFRLSLDKTFVSTIHDYISSQDESYFIDANDLEVRLFKAIIPKE